MKFKVFESPKDSQEVYFKLIQRSDESLTLIACDRCGTAKSCGNILKLTPKGILLCSHINENIGIPLDSLGCIKVEKES